MCTGGDPPPIVNLTDSMPLISVPHSVGKHISPGFFLARMCLQFYCSHYGASSLCTGPAHGMFTVAMKIYLIKYILLKDADSNAEVFRILSQLLAESASAGQGSVSENLLHCSIGEYYTSPTHPVPSGLGTGILVFVGMQQTCFFLSIIFSSVSLVEGLTILRMNTF